MVSNSQTSLLDGIFICGGEAINITGINPTPGLFFYTLNLINMTVFYFFAVILAAVACVLCISQALTMWTEGEDMNWYLLILGVINGIICIINSFHLFNALTL